MAARLVDRHPFLLGETMLGAFAMYGPRQLTARRLAVALHVPPELVLPVLSRIGGRWAGRTAMAFLLHVAFWSGVRSAVPRDRFSATTDGVSMG